MARTISSYRSSYVLLHLSSYRASYRSLSVLLLAASALGPGCKEGARPNTTQPEDKLLFELGNAAVAGDKKASLALYDLELRQKLELWDKMLKPEKNQL